MIKNIQYVFAILFGCIVIFPEALQASVKDDVPAFGNSYIFLVFGLSLGGIRTIYQNRTKV